MILAIVPVIFWSTASTAAAATYRVDDSASLPRESSALLNWRQAVPTRDGDNVLTGTSNLLLRLDVSAWTNRRARLYLVLPEQPAPIIRLHWRTQGRLLPGLALPGQRVLVYDGTIQSPWVEERFDLNIEAAGSGLSSMQPLTFYFEIDVD
jgi:hypothetical protein